MAVIYQKAKRSAPAWNADRIAQALATDWNSPLQYRRQWVVVPRVNSFVPWEMDLLAVTQAGYLTEVEIKVSAADWRNDAEKAKWNKYGQPQFVEGWEKVSYFWYAAPMKLAQRWESFVIPDWAGVYGMTQDTMTRIHVLKPATPRPLSRKLNSEERGQVARLGAMRVWTSKAQREARA